MDVTDFRELRNQNSKKDQLKVQLLTQRLGYCTESSTFLDYFPEVNILRKFLIQFTKAIESLSSKHNIIECINDLFKYLKLSIPIQIIMALSLSQSQNPQIAKEGIFQIYLFSIDEIGLNLLKKKLTEFTKNGKPYRFTDQIYNNLLYMVRSTSFFEVRLDSMSKQ